MSVCVCVSFLVFVCFFTAFFIRLIWLLHLLSASLVYMSPSVFVGLPVSNCIVYLFVYLFVCLPFTSMSICFCLFLLFFIASSVHLSDLSVRLYFEYGHRSIFSNIHFLILLTSVPMTPFLPGRPSGPYIDTINEIMLQQISLIHLSGKHTSTNTKTRLSKVLIYAKLHVKFKDDTLNFTCNFA